MVKCADCGFHKPWVTDPKLGWCTSLHFRQVTVVSSDSLGICPAFKAIDDTKSKSEVFSYPGKGILLTLSRTPS